MCGKSIFVVKPLRYYSQYYCSLTMLHSSGNKLIQTVAWSRQPQAFPLRLVEWLTLFIIIIGYTAVTLHYNNFIHAINKNILKLIEVVRCCSTSDIKSVSLNYVNNSYFRQLFKNSYKWPFVVRIGPLMPKYTELQKIIKHQHPLVNDQNSNIKVVLKL